jgi:hypothetical protein
MKDESIFKKRKQERKFLRRGYIFAFVSSLVVSGGQAAKYHFFIRSEQIRQPQIFVFNWTLNFIIFFGVTFLLARWYYKMKDGQSEAIRRTYWKD